MSVNISNTEPGNEREHYLDEEGEEEHGVGVEDGEHHHGEEGDALHQCPAEYGFLILVMFDCSPYHISQGKTIIFFPLCSPNKAMTSMVVEIVPQHTNQLEQVWKYDNDYEMLPRIPA